MSITFKRLNGYYIGVELRTDGGKLRDIVIAIGTASGVQCKKYFLNQVVSFKSVYSPFLSCGHQIRKFFSWLITNWNILDINFLISFFCSKIPFGFCWGMNMYSKYQQRRVVLLVFPNKTDENKYRILIKEAAII